MTADAYKQEIYKLFSEWKIKTEPEDICHRDKVFISDGVVCPEQWFKQKIRPLFLLKEAYDGTSDWSLVSDHLLLKNRKMSHLWLNVCRWTEGLMNTTSTEIPEFQAELGYQNYGNETLKQIAVVNVKKSDGKCSSKMEEINRYAECDQDELQKELELCDPTIIVCGYTISSLNIILQKNIKKVYNDHWFYWIELNDHPVLVIDYYHPANYYPDLLNYYGLMNIYQCALKSVQPEKE